MMEIEKMFKGVRYTLSNDNLKVGDEVFPIGRGRVKENGNFILRDLDFRDFMSGFPEKPHKILDLKYDEYKPYEVRTDRGYSPKESYYKIVKKEHKITEWDDNGLFKYKVKNEWIEF